MTYGVEIRNKFLEALYQKVPISRISKKLKVCIPTLDKWKIAHKKVIEEQLFLVQTDLDEIKKPRGRKTKSPNNVQIIKDYVDNHNGCSLNEIREHLQKGLSESRICRICRKENITRKRFVSHVYNKDPIVLKKEQKDFALSMDQKTFMDVISLDESSFHVNDVRKYGYSKKGVPFQLHQQVKGPKEKRSLLATVSKNKTGCYQIYKGSINSQVLLDFLEKNRLQFVNKTILLDNARAHHAKIVTDWAFKNNVKLLFNCPYSPEFNPIENAFGKMKTIFRRSLNHKDVVADINDAVKSINPQDLENFYNHAWNNLLLSSL